MTDDVATTTQVLDAAEHLFYGRGIHEVGMDDIRTESGVSLKRLYQLFGSKTALVAAFLTRRDAWWRGRVQQRVDQESQPRQRLLAVFDALADLFGEPDFRGCAWINASGEMGAVSRVILERSREHKIAFRQIIAELVAEAGLPDQLTDQLSLLVEGALVTAGLWREVDAAKAVEQATIARAAAGVLVDAAQ